MQEPLVSVIVSAYNRPGMLKEALDSLKGQTYTNLEILVQDDSSTDECENVAADYAGGPLHYTHNRPSLGTLRNLLAGYRRASGKYFSTLNDDDVYAPDYLRSMVAVLESDPTCSIAFADHHLIDQNGTVLVDETQKNSRTFGRAHLTGGDVTEVLRTALISKAVPGMFALYRREAIDLDNFPEAVDSAYDYWLTYLAVHGGAPIHYTPARLTSYRVHDTSQTASFGDPTDRLRYHRYNRFIDEQLLGDELLRPIWPQLRTRLGDTLAAEGITYLRVDERGKAVESLRRSLAHRVTRKNLLGVTLCCLPGHLRQLLLRK